MKTRKAFPLAFLMFLGLCSLGPANGLYLNSLGSRALSMGGAFVGLADDYSAIYWNPAGMAQFNKRYLGFYGTDIIPTGNYLLEVPAEAGPLTMVDAKTQGKHYLSGLIAYYWPIDDRFVAGFGLYAPAGLGTAWDGDDFANLSNRIPYEWESKIGLVTVSPGVSYKVSDMVSVGATLNINYGMFSLKRWAGEAGELDLGQFELNMKGWGFGATAGVLVKASDALSFGATVRTPSRVKFSGDAFISNLGLLEFMETSEAETEPPHVTFPLWIAGGVAFRPLPGLTLTGDLQWTQWSALDQVELKFIDPLWSAFMAQSGEDKLHLEWEDALQVRFGAEYTLKENLALRAGYYYDPTPTPEKTMNFVLPTYTFNVFTAGVGYFLNGLVIDLGFEYLAGKGREVEYARVLSGEFPYAQPGDYDLRIVVPNISVGYRF